MKLKLLLIAASSALLFSGLHASKATDLKEACIKDDSKACFELGNILTASDKEKDQTIGILMWTKGCELNHASSCTSLGAVYYGAVGSFPEGKQKNQIEKNALKFSEKGAKLGDVDGMYNSHIMLKTGTGIKKDPAGAYRYLEMACENNLGDGCYGVALSRYRGELVSKDFKTAINAARKACDLKVESACYLVGNMSDAGKGTDGDPVEALRYYHKSCDLGGARGCMFVGIGYQNGKYGYKQDDAKAKEFLDRGCKNAKQGNMHANIISMTCSHQK